MKPPVEDNEDDFAAEEENKIINEEYKIWKKNAPYLYDMAITHALDWPSLTCQWLPDKEQQPGKPYSTHRLLLGTHTSGQAQDYLQIATVQIPHTASTYSDKLHRGDYDDARGELGGHTLPPAPRVQIIQRINHDGEVNRARYMPQNPDLIATKTVRGDVYVFDRTKHSSEPERGGVCKPDIRLVGQHGDGFGLSWNPCVSGHIASASEDMTVCQWDVNSYSKEKPSIEPLNTFRGHTSIVGDVDWNAKGDMLASVGDDKMLILWDPRTSSAASKMQAHEREILAVAFSPACDHLLVTGSADKTIVLHDIRQPYKKLHTFEFHTDEVLHLAWSPHNATIFASASGDRRINVWDLSLIGVEQTPEDLEDGPPELLFMHGGHTAPPTDFCWAPGIDENWTIASTSEDNIVMAWQPTMRIWAGEELKIDEKELESDAMDGVESTGVAESAPEDAMVVEEPLAAAPSAPVAPVPPARSPSSKDTENGVTPEEKASAAGGSDKSKEKQSDSQGSRELSMSSRSMSVGDD